MLYLYLSKEETICIFAVVLIFGLLGFVLNLLLISSITLTDGFAEIPANFFVLSLAVSDTMIDCVAAPLMIYNMYHFAFEAFLVVGKFFGLATTGSVFLLTLNRFISTVKALKYPTIVTFKRAVTMVGAIWFVALLVAVKTTASLISDLVPNVSVARNIVVFYVLTSIALCVYMYKLGRKHAKRVKQQAFAVTGELQAASHEFKTLRTLFLIAGSLGACMLPTTALFLVIDREEHPAQFHRAFSFIAPLVLLNTIIDPFVYYFRSKGFRMSLKTLKRRFTNSGCFY
ncbi:adrenocorticotropic hormone receptor-like [Dendronephthya gigantea]|uniref:adrenocorticotropic hormone receptor-like n=1 Tax=Dendronephthya gigantea TaxID=151771 RepID=UPI00106A8B4B|nr:adrenocorticotropic hormone receptor-like [Dendronephthya gigantea]